MEIECQGCYYTVCSFVCLTEDLSEILQFLWRHGCLRKSYACEKCGRKCAIGDKDLFFRCNRNLLDESTDPKIMQNNCGMQPSHQQHLEVNRSSLSLDLNYLSHPYLLGGGMDHPALRHTSPLPGDPLPPSHVSPVLQPLDRNFLLAHAPLIQPQDPNVLHSVKAEDMGNLPNAELADLDVASKQHKRSTKNGGSTSVGLKKRCNFKVSMKKGTFFEKSKLPIDTVCKFVVFWCCMKHPTQEFLRNELSLATRTVVDWSTTCREICIHWARANSEKIGGDGVIVQVDEVKIVGGKTAETGNLFSFWGIEKDKEKGKIFIVPVRVCDLWSLLSVINDWVLPGSVIISNCWKTYDCLKLQEYIQQTVVHSKTFVHPPNNSGPNNFDVKVEDAGTTGKDQDLQMPRFGTRRSHHLGDLAEFMFKRRYSNHLERMHAFFKQVAMAYPLR